MKPAFLNEEHLKRLKILMKINNKIVIENHIRDYTICYNYYNYGIDIDLFENMLNGAFLKIERKLKYNRKKLYIFEDYVDIYEEIVEIALKKASTFNGACLFSTWVYGIMKYALLKYYHKKSRINETKLIENAINNTTSQNSIVDQFIYKEALNLLAKPMRVIFSLHVDYGFTLLEISQKFKKPLNLIENIYNQAKIKLLHYYKA